MQTPYYILAPIVGYFVAGGLKFFLNSLTYRKLAFTNIGMGGMPSTHNCICSSTFFTIGIGEGFSSPVTAIAFTVSIIVAIDSMDLRQKIEDHALIISSEYGKVSRKAKNLRTSIGHKPKEVLAGWILGGICSLFICQFL